MKKLLILATLEYDDTHMHDDDEEGCKWFREELLRKPPGLTLVSEEIGDEVGTVHIHMIAEDPVGKSRKNGGGDTMAGKKKAAPKAKGGKKGGMC